MKERITTGDAPAAVGPYSQAIKAGGWLWCSGQLPLDPATGQLVEGSVGEMTRRTLANLQAVLEAGGANLEQVVKCTVYLENMDDFGEMNEVFAQFFPNIPPARAAVEVARLPKGARLEIDAVAYCGG